MSNIWHDVDPLDVLVLCSEALEGKDAVAGGIRNREAAAEVIQEAIRNYRDTFC